MITQDLLKYIEGELSKGTTKEVVQSNLLSNGWSSDDVAEGLSVAIPKNNNIVPPSSPIYPNINIQNTPQFSVPGQNYQLTKTPSLKKFNPAILISTIVAIVFICFAIYSSGCTVPYIKFHNRNIKCCFGLVSSSYEPVCSPGGNCSGAGFSECVIGL